jgi:1-acyl-sn-glycerol-3-phosphate acyltransferase
MSAEPASRINDFPPVATGHPIQFRGSALARAALRLLGWRYHFEGFPAPQGVAIVYPHTSNWDAPVMFLVKAAIGVPVMFWGKDTLFRMPLLGRWLRWFGGVPVERTSAHGVARGMVSHMLACKARGEYFWLGLSPEGTRKFIPGWRSGFYRVAVGADVPLLCVTLDWSLREVGVRQFLRLSGDEALDMARLSQVYADVHGLRPALAAPIQLLDSSVPRAEAVVKSRA